jgi:hypothetical protein
LAHDCLGGNGFAACGLLRLSCNCLWLCVCSVVVLIGLYPSTVVGEMGERWWCQASHLQGAYPLSLDRQI